MLARIAGHRDRAVGRDIGFMLRCRLRGFGRKQWSVTEKRYFGFWICLDRLAQTFLRQIGRKIAVYDQLDVFTVERKREPRHYGGLDFEASIMVGVLLQ